MASAAGEKVETPAGAEAVDGNATPERVRQALRSGPVGCANADAAGLNRQERTHCNDLLGKNMAQIQRAMREAEQVRLSTGGKPPTDFERFKAAEARVKEAATANPRCAGSCVDRAPSTRDPSHFSNIQERLLGGQHVQRPLFAEGSPIEIAIVSASSQPGRRPRSAAYTAGGLDAACLSASNIGARGPVAGRHSIGPLRRCAC